MSNVIEIPHPSINLSQPILGANRKYGGGTPNLVPFNLAYISHHHVTGARRLLTNRRFYLF